MIGVNEEKNIYKTIGFNYLIDRRQQVEICYIIK
jgi:hypothetical protein